MGIGGSVSVGGFWIEWCNLFSLIIGFLFCVWMVGMDLEDKLYISILFFLEALLCGFVMNVEGFIVCLYITECY